MCTGYCNFYSIPFVNRKTRFRWGRIKLSVVKFQRNCHTMIAKSNVVSFNPWRVLTLKLIPYLRMKFFYFALYSFLTASSNPSMSFIDQSFLEYMESRGKCHYWEKIKVSDSKKKNFGLGILVLVRYFMKLNDI